MCPIHKDFLGGLYARELISCTNYEATHAKLLSMNRGSDFNIVMIVGISICLVWNFVAVTANWIVVKDNGKHYFLFQVTHKEMIYAFNIYVMPNIIKECLLQFMCMG